MKKTFLLFAIIFAVSCTPPKDLTDPQVIVNESIAFHGLQSLNNAQFSLSFRGLDYTYQNQNGLYEYTRTQTDSTGAIIYDVLNNDGLIRYIDGKEVEITEERRGAYARSVNSVIEISSNGSKQRIRKHEGVFFSFILSFVKLEKNLKEDRHRVVVVVICFVMDLIKKFIFL